MFIEGPFVILYKVGASLPTHVLYILKQDTHYKNTLLFEEYSKIDATLGCPEDSTGFSPFMKHIVTTPPPFSKKKMVFLNTLKLKKEIII